MQIRESDMRPEGVYPSHDAMEAIDLGGLREKRIRKFRRLLDEREPDALLLTKQENVRYVTDIRPVHSIYFTNSYQVLLTGTRL